MRGGPVRYIGSKSRLLGFIREVIERKAQGARTACDIFAGTAAVSGLLKRMGFTVISNDIMEYSYAFQVAAVQVCEYPRFDDLYDSRIVAQVRAEIQIDTAWSPLEVALPEEAARLAGVINYLNAGHKSRGFFWNHFSKDTYQWPAFRPPQEAPPQEERMFFTSENAERIDGIRTILHEWRTSGRLTEVEFYLLLAVLIDAADAAANTTGVYGAFLKEFGTRPGKLLELRVPHVNVQSPAKPHRCRRDTAAGCAGKEKFDLLYLDPPYNRRDYAANYHVPELIARGWFETEPTLEGKTGMVKEFGELRSDFCLKGKCVGALEEVVNTAVAHSGVRFILLSYNTEGLIPDEEIERVLRSAGRPGTFERFRRDYKRYRSDSDSRERRYKGDRVEELLYYVEVGR
jgi:adenine-specific DNA methylase